MQLDYLLTSFEGRISRAKYWLGAIFLTVVSIAGTLAALAMFGVSNAAVVMTVGVALALFYPTYALMAKRFQDRDKSGTNALYALASIYGINLIQTVGIIEPSSPAFLSHLCDVIVVGITLWLLVALGLLKGTQGPNRFGPDPLGAARNDAEL